MNDNTDNRKKIIFILLGFVLLVGLSFLVFYFVLSKDTSDDAQDSDSSRVSTETQTTNSGEASPSTTSQSSQSNTSQPGVADYTASNLEPYIEKIDGLTDSNNQPTFYVSNVQQPTIGWYVVTITPKNQDNAQSAYVILNATGNTSNPMRVVAGPGGYFDPSKYSLPSEVREALGQ